jgi:KDO2-lipid IV(A) lauroyltransferase
MSDTPGKRWDADIELPAPRSNKPVTFSRRVEARLFFGLLWLMKQLPVSRAARMLGGMMRRVGPLLKTVQRRGLANLRLIYPDMTEAERKAILRDAWENVGSTTAEYAHIDSIAERVTVENGELLRQLAEENRQAIFISGHFANWEAMGAVLQREGVRFAVVYRAPNNALVDERIIELRGRAITRLQIPKGKRGGRQLLQALKDGYSLSMLVDQKLNDGIEVPLLGHPAMTPPAAARLAIKMNLPLIPLQMIRRPGSKFICTVHEPILPEGRSTEELTLKINETIGSFILARPEQWLWFHRRWPAELTPA